MRKWREVPVGATIYTVYLATENELRKVSDQENAVAYHNGDSAKIYLLNTLSPSQAASALTHELLHAVMQESAARTHIENLAGNRWNDAAEEIFVRSIENCLTPALMATGWKPLGRKK